MRGHISRSTSLNRERKEKEEREREQEHYERIRQRENELKRRSPSPRNRRSPIERSPRRGSLDHRRPRSNVAISSDDGDDKDDEVIF